MGACVSKDFAEAPLRGAVLPEALRDIVADAVAEDVRGGVGLRDVAAALADDRDKFHLIIDELARLRDEDWSWGLFTDVTAFVNQTWFAGVSTLLLGDVVGVVQADREDLTGPRHGRVQVYGRKRRRFSRFAALRTLSPSGFRQCRQ